MRKPIQQRVQVVHKQLERQRLSSICYTKQSKTCSGCGDTQPMPLWKRTYRCGNCGLVMDRDENSAVNQLRTRLKSSTRPQKREGL